jgi:hypothetical protein
MRVLEARFHPWRKARGTFLVVGRIHCRRGGADIEPEPVGLEEHATARQETMLQKLEYLVRKSGGDAFSHLRDLRSDFWSFVEIDRKRLS